MEITWNRLKPEVQQRTRRIEWMKDRFDFEADPMLWDHGPNYVVRGDCIAVMRSMPESFVTLVIADPPFNANREFRNRKGEGFSDVWRWDAAAEDRLREIEDLPKEGFGGKNGKEALLAGIEAARLMDPKLASYLTWCALLLFECRRVMGDYEYDDSRTAGGIPLLGLGGPAGPASRP